MAPLEPRLKFIDFEDFFRGFRAVRDEREYPVAFGGVADGCLVVFPGKGVVTFKESLGGLQGPET